MTALAARLREPIARAPHPARAVAAVAGLVAVAAVTAGLATGDATLRFAIVGVAGVLAIGLAARVPAAVLVLVALWLPLLGLARRVVEYYATPEDADALILIAPVAFGVLTVFAAMHGAFARMTALSKTVLALSVVVLLGAVNTEYQTLRAGLAALIFLLVPMLAFWVGRAFCDDALLRRVLFVAAGAAIVAGAYGIGQALVVFPRWDDYWVETSGYTSLYVGDTVRPFSSFASAAEFGYFLAVGIAVWVVYGSRRARFVFALPVVALLLLALVLESSRGVAMTLVLALGLVVAARRGVRLPSALSIGAVTVLAVVLSLRLVASDGAPGQLSLLSHQLEGLAYPLDPERSTATAHLSLIGDGIRLIAREPLGHGASTVTAAARRLDETNATFLNTEADPGNAAAALGLPGLVLYALLVVLAVPRLYRHAAARRDLLSIAALGVVLVTALQWLNGGQYAVAYLPWLVLGWLDRPREEHA